MRATIYQLGAIALIVIMVSLFARSTTQSITGNSIYDNPALFSNRCETYFDGGLLYAGTIFNNYCYVKQDDLREYLHKYECVASHIQVRDVDCQAQGKMCVKGKCVLSPKTRKYTNS